MRPDPRPPSGPVPRAGSTPNRGGYDPHRLVIDYAHVVGSAVNGARHALPADCPAPTATTVLAELRTAADNLGRLLDDLARAVWRAHLQLSDDVDRADQATDALRDGAVIADQLSIALQAAHHDISTLTASPVTIRDGNRQTNQERQP